ncbi:MAG: PRD domain-containing protein [Clostridiales bacterium]|jgi:mannitol operon transcriptional antiterminator|nr:PRD domain-containing protein [Clostridiales bacterium]
MQSISPRLSLILHILLRTKKPISVGLLGEQIGASRRTVFRELESVDKLLKPYALKIGIITGKGIILEGAAEGKTRLRSELDNRGVREPASWQERQDRLTLSLLLSREPQKIYYFAHMLRVSEATVSNDLSKIETWLREYGISLVRKPSYGVFIEGREHNIRRACISLMRKNQSEYRPGSLFPNKKIAEGMEAISSRLDKACEWMTPESKYALNLYISTAAARIQDAYIVDAAQEDARFLVKAEEISELMESAFGITLHESEKAALSVELSACRSNAVSIPRMEDERDAYLLRLSHQLIEAFDPAMAMVLKLDDALIDGLVVHLRSTIVRLKNRVELQDELMEQIADKYPDIMIRSERAAQVLAAEVLAPGDEWMPESEISYLAIHFGAALHRLKEQGAYRRMVKIGVICLNGIGTSYLLAEQVKKHFEAVAFIEVGDWCEPSQWRRYDLLISTVPLKQAPLPVIVTSPFLGEESIKLIGEEIERISASERNEAPSQRTDGSFARKLSQLGSLCDDMQALLLHFSAAEIDSGCAFERLAEFAGAFCGASSHAALLIKDGLIERERLSTQVVPEIGFVLLHCRTDGAEIPRFALICPKGGKFTDPHFKGAKSCALMLMPKASSRERLEMMGAISSAMVNNDQFLEAMLSGAKEQTYYHLELILQNHLIDFMKKNWKG